jgi:23S rRNA (cytidine2498-2'-O)-methyltransferase
MNQTNTPWLFTTRNQFEEDLLEELTLEGDKPTQAGPSLVLTQKAPSKHPTFGRQGFPISHKLEGDDLVKPLVESFLAEYKRISEGKKKPATIQFFVPDADETNPLSALATQLEQQVKQQIIADEYFSKRIFESAEQCRDLDGILWQVCLAKEKLAYAGGLLCTQAPSLFVGGRARLKLRDEMPSRAALKLEEAFHWVRRAPDAGDTCVDLGAAPGGWTYVLLERRAKVLAVDPAKLSPEIMKRKGVKHFCQSAFQFEPPESVLWLCCDMAWRPMEVAQLLAKWGRKRWATFLISNIKLPMKQKAAVVKELTKTIASGGWQDVMARQLYHDREEVTFSAWR